MVGREIAGRLAPMVNRKSWVSLGNPVLFAATVGFLATFLVFQLLPAQPRRAVGVLALSRHLGTIPPGQHEVLFALQNHSPKELRLLGSSSTCGCVATTGIPAVIRANSSQNIRIQATVKEGMDQYKQTVRVFTDSKEYPFVDLHIEATIELQELQSPNKDELPGPTDSAT